MAKARNDDLIREFLNDKLYQVYPNGKIMTFVTREGHSIGPWREKSQQKTDCGYFAIQYRGKRIATHRLVYQAFVGPLDSDREINHKDGNPSNNVPSNLELATPSENLLHSYRVLGRKPNCTQTRYPREKIDEILADRAAGFTLRRLVEKHGLSKSMLSYIINGKTRVEK